MQMQSSLLVAGGEGSGGSEVEEEFAFDIEPHLLIDLRLILVGEMIGEGSYSVVHQGLWVFFFFSFLDFFNLVFGQCMRLVIIIFKWLKSLNPLTGFSLVL